MTGRVVISMDSHTELMANLKPFMPRQWHDEFEKGEQICKRYFTKVIATFAAVTEDLKLLEDSAMSIRLPEGDRREATVEEYNRPLPMNQRLKAIDEDGVAAEFITPFIGAFSDDPDFLHQCSLAYHRYFGGLRLAGATAFHRLDSGQSGVRHRCGAGGN